MEESEGISRRGVLGMAAAMSGSSFGSSGVFGDSRETVGAAGTDNGRGQAGRQSQCEPGGAYATGRALPDVELGNNAGAMVDGRLYSIGGILDDVGDERLLQATDEVLAYDVREDAWDRTVENLPRKLWGMDAIGVDGAVYAWGGAEPEAPFGEGTDDPAYMSESIYRLVPGEGWTELAATVPGGVLMESRSLYDPADELVYVFGGAVSAEENTDRIWAFDPETEAVVDERWATLPEPTRWPSVGLVEVDGRRYAHCMGGIAYDEEGHYTIDANVRYELATAEAERMTDLEEGLVHATGQNPVLDNVVYLLKGRRALAYNPVDDTFSTVESIGEEVSFGAHGVFDGELILLGGHDKVESGAHEGAHDTEDRVWRYKPPC